MRGETDGALRLSTRQLLQRRTSLLTTAVEAELKLTEPTVVETGGATEFTMLVEELDAGAETLGRRAPLTTRRFGALFLVLTMAEFGATIRGKLRTRDLTRTTLGFLHVVERSGPELSNMEVLGTTTTKGGVALTK